MAAIIMILSDLQAHLNIPHTSGNVAYIIYDAYSPAASLFKCDF